MVYEYIAAALVTAVVGWALIPGKRKSSRDRSMSFSSRVMVSGAFPPEATVAPPIINIVFFMKKCPSVDDVIKSASQVLFFDRFRSTVHIINGQHEFKLLNDFAVDSIIKSKIVSDENELQAEIECIAKQSLDDVAMVPAWAIHRLENSSSDGVSALLVRVHHVIGDGVSLVTCMARMFDEGSSGLPQAPSSLPSEAGSKKQSIPSVSQICTGASTLLGILSLATSPFDSDTRFSGGNKSSLRMTSTRSVVLFPALHLSFLKELKNAAGTTINDVMLAITSGAIRRYCEKLGDHSLANTIQTRALVPVAAPRSSSASSDPGRALRNYWAFISCPLPVGTPSSRERLGACRDAMNNIKRTHAAAIQLWLQTHMLPKLPQFLRRKTAFDIFSRHSIVFSNVPGPPEPIHFAGEKVVGIQVVFPNILPQCLIVSYAGEVFMNMVLDLSVVKEGDVLLPALYVEEALALAKEFGLSREESDIVSKTSGQGRFGVIA